MYQIKIMKRVPLKYVPKKLSKRETKKVKAELKKSRQMYKKKQYYTRKKVKGYKSKPSRHILQARKIYKVEDIMPSKELAIKTGCSIEALREIEKKGMSTLR